MRTSLRSFVTLSTVFAPALAFAGGYAIPNENARDLGLSQATVASQTGPEAVYQNASQLAGQQGFAASASLEGLYNQTSWTAPGLGSSSINPQWSLPPAAAVSYGDRVAGMAYGVGLGLVIPGGGQLNWPAGWPGDEVVQTVSQRVYLMQAGGGLQVLPYLKVGATLLYYRVSEQLTQAIGFISNQGTADLGLSGGAFSFGLSGEISVPQIPLKIGIDYRHKGDIGLSGNVHFAGVPETFQTLLHDQAVTSPITVPNEFWVGAAYDITHHFQLMGSWNLERWIVYKQDAFIGADGFSTVVPRDYRNAYVFRLAGEYKGAYWDWLTLRAGGLRSISPQPTNTISPSLSDGDSWAFSVGAGFQVIQQLRIDIGYQHAWFDTVTSTPPAFPGTYNTKVDLLSVGATLRL
jgi:long-chain fatty acid transport protein